VSSSLVTLVGNVTRDPELRFTPSGLAVATFGLAVNRRWKKGEEWQESVSFFDVTVWQEYAENVCESLPKGTRVVVLGRIEQESWEDQEGNKRSKLKVVADEVAPSLRWATAEVRKIERREPDPGQRQPSGPAYEDEEPF
jgi:single-strand DNA-binding protein